MIQEKVQRTVYKLTCLENLFFYQRSFGNGKSWVFALTWLNRSHDKKEEKEKT